MAESTFRSKYAGKPGSLVAIRVDYGRGTAAFDGAPPESATAVHKRDVQRFKMGHRLGDKPAWNTSTQPEGFVGGAPIRQKMHQLNEFQAVKLEHNFRAPSLPTVNQQTRFVPKPSKLQVDRSLFLSPTEKKLLVPQNPGTSTVWSRSELQGNPQPGADREAGWQPSVSLPSERTDIYHLRKYEDVRALNKTKGMLNEDTYVPPHKRHVLLQQQARTTKLERREEDARRREIASASLRGGAGLTSVLGGGEAGPTPSVYKMSNINEWWDNDFDAQVAATASAVLGKPIQLSSAAHQQPSTDDEAGTAADPA